MHLGMIGIGLMGHGIASNLQRHGHALTLLEHPGNQPLDALRDGGARTVATPAAVAAASDLLILCVTGSPQVEAVLTGPDGVLAALRPGGIVVDCSTALPDATLRMAAAVEAAGGRFLDAPMTRTPKEAAEGRLNLLVGGEAALLAQVEPVLRCFAEHVTHVGPVGAGHRMKLLHNYVSLGSVALLAEASACALRGGLDPRVFVDVLARGGGHGAALQRIAPYLTAGDAGALRFALGHAHKDLGYYATMAAEAGAAHGIADAVLQTLADSAAQAGPATPMPALVSVLAGRPLA